MGVERAGGCSHTDTDIQDAKLQKKTQRYVSLHKRPSWPAILPEIASPTSPPPQLLAVWLIVRFAPLKTPQYCAEMGLGAGGGESLVAHSAGCVRGQWKFSQAESSL